MDYLYAELLIRIHHGAYRSEGYRLKRRLEKTQVYLRIWCAQCEDSVLVCVGSARDIGRGLEHPHMMGVYVDPAHNHSGAHYLEVVLLN